MRMHMCVCVHMYICMYVIKFLNTVSWTMDMCSFTCHETVNRNRLEVSAVQALHLMYQTQEEQIISDNLRAEVLTHVIPCSFV
jgi:hypothetical protein